MLPAWGSLHENAMYVEEHRMTPSTRESCDSLTEPLPDNFQTMDTATRPSGQPPANESLTEDLAGMTSKAKAIV